MFENDVEMYGAQTLQISRSHFGKFENDVEMYGAQTPLRVLFMIKVTLSNEILKYIT